MKVLERQIGYLNLTRTVLHDCLKNAEERNDSTQALNLQNAMEVNAKNLTFLTSMNDALGEVGPDVCPKCGHDLGE